MLKLGKTERRRNTAAVAAAVFFFHGVRHLLRNRTGSWMFFFVQAVDRP